MVADRLVSDQQVGGFKSDRYEHAISRSLRDFHRNCVVFYNTRGTCPTHGRRTHQIVFFLEDHEARLSQVILKGFVVATACMGAMRNLPRSATTV